MVEQNKDKIVHISIKDFVEICQDRIELPYFCQVVTFLDYNFPFENLYPTYSRFKWENIPENFLSRKFPIKKTMIKRLFEECEHRTILERLFERKSKFFSVLLYKVRTKMQAIIACLLSKKEKHCENLS